MFCYIFYAYFYPKTYEAFRNEEIIIISLFFKVQILVLGITKLFMQCLVDILPLGSEALS